MKHLLSPLIFFVTVSTFAQNPERIPGEEIVLDSTSVGQ